MECRGTYCWPKDYEVAKQYQLKEALSDLNPAEQLYLSFHLFREITNRVEF